METKTFKIDYITDNDIMQSFSTSRLERMLNTVTEYINSGGSYNSTKIAMNKLDFGFEQTRGDGFIRVSVFDRGKGAKCNFKFLG